MYPQLSPNYTADPCPIKPRQEEESHYSDTQGTDLLCYRPAPNKRTIKTHAVSEQT